MSNARVNRDLNKQTKGEQLWVWRKFSHMTGIEAAKYWSIGRNAYWNNEADLQDDIPQWVFVSELRSDGLLFKLARRRMGWGLEETARRVGVSHQTLLSWEETARPCLREWWEKKGFTFP